MNILILDVNTRLTLDDGKQQDIEYSNLVDTLKESNTYLNTTRILVNSYEMLYSNISAGLESYQRVIVITSSLMFSVIELHLKPELINTSVILVPNKKLTSIDKLKKWDKFYLLNQSTKSDIKRLQRGLIHKKLAACVQGSALLALEDKLSTTLYTIEVYCKTVEECLEVRKIAETLKCNVTLVLAPNYRYETTRTKA